MAGYLRGSMAQSTEICAKQEPAMFYRRIEVKLGVTSLRSDLDLARLGMTAFLSLRLNRSPLME